MLYVENANWYETAIDMLIDNDKWLYIWKVWISMIMARYEKYA